MTKATRKLSLAVALFVFSSPECLAFVARIRSPNFPFANIRPESTGKSWGGSSAETAACRKASGNRMSKSNNNNYGQDMDQEAMMESDMLVAVDQDDILIDTGSSTSKKLAHTFNDKQPRGVLHRAFSFFLFDQDNKMLLTQRASSKITFPSVWTNTCCSHPLYGMTPDEVDPVPAAYPEFPGIKHAAIRKCQHELGIAPENIEHDKITFISRFQYWAADTVTYGKEAPWGEHGTCHSRRKRYRVLHPDQLSQNVQLTFINLRHLMPLQRNSFQQPTIDNLQLTIHRGGLYSVL